jgi:hypothetical protein
LQPEPPIYRGGDKKSFATFCCRGYIKALYDGTGFKPKQPVPVKGDYEAAVVFTAPVNKNTADMKSAKRSRSELRGILKGKVWMSEDFDEPLEEMREYME